ncbi:hypothetical protein V496_05138 [Pseudogymnoascus sp. VKM F-4515 (FW-2607)]|nr:hypothetical protein V496_05138 [Pseudogymnoascus sp. VKM F-4515 (FW-2607)]
MILTNSKPTPQTAAEASNPANTNLCNTPTLIDSRADVINGGSTSLIHLVPSGHIRKNVYPDHLDRARFTERLEIESRIYARLPKKHPRHLEMFSYSREEGLVLEFMPRGDLGKYLRGEDPRTQRGGELRGAREAVEVSPKQRLQWACDAAEGLALLHGHGVWHCDVRAMNFLVDEGLRLRIIDFEGSSIDGVEGAAVETARFFLPREWKEPSTARTEVFALGSLVYEIMTGREPYQEVEDDDEVTALFVEKRFPPVDGLMCGDVMMKCWLGEVESAEEMYLLIKARM